MSAAESATQLVGEQARHDHAATMRQCRETLARNSKTFAMAARLLPASARDRAASLYSYCRLVDDAIDDCPAEQQLSALQALEAELHAVYNGQTLGKPVLEAFHAVIETTRLPRRYPTELLEGMAMDVRSQRYQTRDELLLYCHRVAGVVGLMMCHVFGVTRESALPQAAQLGIAMQLTNICRDVAEDFGLGRIYLPRDMLEAAGARDLPLHPTGPLPHRPELIRAMSSVMRSLLREADRYYESAERGIAALPFRAGLAARAAMHLYRAIGDVIAARDFDPTRGRAVVSTSRKLLIVAKVVAKHLLSTPLFLFERLRARGGARLPSSVLDFPEEVLR